MKKRIILTISILLPWIMLGRDASAEKVARCATPSPPTETLGAVKQQFTEYLAVLAQQQQQQQQQHSASAYNVRLISTSTVSPASAGDKLPRLSPVTIEVAFHVITKGPKPEDGNVPETQLDKQIDVLNNAYRGSFNFHKLSVDRTIHRVWFEMVQGGNLTEREAKSTIINDRVPGSKSTNTKNKLPTVLHIYTAKPKNEDPRDTKLLLGWATWPWDYSVRTKTPGSLNLDVIHSDQDGVVLLYETLPGGKPLPKGDYDLGMTAVHEVGHWLGLLHTFTGGCDSVFNDRIFDTPRQAKPTDGCPATPVHSCPAEKGDDPIHNYMNYSDDKCLSEFTEEQTIQNQHFYQLFRKRPLTTP